jgi:hypothetical protein
MSILPELTLKVMQQADTSAQQQAAGLKYQNQCQLPP